MVRRLIPIVAVLWALAAGACGEPEAPAWLEAYAEAQATGEPTARGKSIIDHTPMDRYGEAEDLKGVAIWLASDASKFVTGTMIPVDGGFSAYSGV